MTIDALVFTCEHGGNTVPARYAPLFAGTRATRALASHRGYDLGALAAARVLARRFGAPLVFSTVTRLLVDLNRSPGHPRLFSEFSSVMAPAERREVLESRYRRHRAKVHDELARHIGRGARTLHVAVHSFTPRLNGETRAVDIGLLYDPQRAAESDLCAAWKTALVRAHPALRVRRNHPYRGTDDGLTKHLRGVFGVGRYLGIELELNQALASKPVQARQLIRAAGDSLREVVG